MCVDATPPRGPSKHRRRPRPGQRGITLLEVMISLAVFTVGILGLTRMQVLAATADAHARRVDQATAVARDLLAWLYTVDFDHPALQSQTAAFADDPIDEARVFAQRVLPANVADFVDTGETPSQLIDVAAPLPAFSLFPQGNRPSLDFNGDGQPDFERYWRITPMQVERQIDGVMVDVVGITAVVRWRDPATGGFRRVALFGTRYDPDNHLPPLLGL